MNEAESVTVKCSNCGAGVSIKSNLIGRIVRCATCNRGFLANNPAPNVIQWDSTVEPPQARRNNEPAESKKVRTTPRDSRIPMIICLTLEWHRQQMRGQAISLEQICANAPQWIDALRSSIDKLDTLRPDQIKAHFADVEAAIAEIQRTPDEVEDFALNNAEKFVWWQRLSVGRKFAFQCPGCGTEVPLKQRVAQTKRRCPGCGFQISLAAIDKQLEKWEPSRLKQLRDEKHARVLRDFGDAFRRQHFLREQMRPHPRVAKKGNGCMPIFVLMVVAVCFVLALSFAAWAF